MTEHFQVEYSLRLRQILKWNLNSRNNIEGIKTWEISNLSYGSGVTAWGVDVLKCLDKTSSKLLIRYDIFHPKMRRKQTECSNETSLMKAQKWNARKQHIIVCEQYHRTTIVGKKKIRLVLGKTLQR